VPSGTVRAYPASTGGKSGGRVKPPPGACRGDHGMRSATKGADLAASPAASCFATLRSTCRGAGGCPQPSAASLRSSSESSRFPSRPRRSPVGRIDHISRANYRHLRRDFLDLPEHGRGRETRDRSLGLIEEREELSGSAIRRRRACASRGRPWNGGSGLLSGPPLNREWEQERPQPTRHPSGSTAESILNRRSDLFAHPRKDVGVDVHRECRP